MIAREKKEGGHIAQTQSQRLGPLLAIALARKEAVDQVTLQAMFTVAVEVWQKGYINPARKNNYHLREMLEISGLIQPAALAIFNLGLGPAA